MPRVVASSAPFWHSKGGAATTNAVCSTNLSGGAVATARGVAACKILFLLVAVIMTSMYMDTRFLELYACSMAEEQKNVPAITEAEVPSESSCFSRQERSSLQERVPNTTYGFTVVHFNERNMSFLKEIPTQWTLSVYETGGENVSHASIPFQNAGSEECTAYFDYMIRNYENLPDISFFLQSDGLVGYPNQHDDWGGHTPFSTIQQMLSVTNNKILSEGQKFVNFGRPMQFGAPIRRGDSYLGELLQELWSDAGLAFDNETHAWTRPGACFAVARERITANPRSVYEELQRKILSSNPDVARRRCCALENSWHALLGEPPMLPPESSIDEIYECLEDK